jgi:hypothetical protein
MHLRIYTFIIQFLIPQISRGALVISKDHRPQVSIVLSDQASPPEIQASMELAEYRRRQAAKVMQELVVEKKENGNADKSNAEAVKS